MNLVDILNQHRNLTKVDIENSKDAKPFWYNLTKDIYQNTRSETIEDWNNVDRELRDRMSRMV